MTDRYSSVTVVFERDIRSDDAEQLLSAISMLKGVQSVTPHVRDLSEHIAEERARHKLVTQIYDILRPKP